MHATACFIHAPDTLTLCSGWGTLGSWACARRTHRPRSHRMRALASLLPPAGCVIETPDVGCEQKQCLSAVLHTIVLVLSVRAPTMLVQACTRATLTSVPWGGCASTSLCVCVSRWGRGSTLVLWGEGNRGVHKQARTNKQTHGRPSRRKVSLLLRQSMLRNTHSCSSAWWCETAASW